MNTGYGFFNLAVAIRDMRPNNDRENPELPVADEPRLPRIEYSLLADLPTGAPKAVEAIAPGFFISGTVRRIWV